MDTLAPFTRQEIEAVCESADKTSQAISARRTAMDREGRQDEPLVVLFAETHDQPAHIIHQMAILRDLASQEKLLLGYEQPSNVMFDLIYDALGAYPNVDQCTALQAQDHKGDLSLMCAHAFGHYQDAPHSTELFFRFLLGGNIPTVFNDAPMRRTLVPVPHKFGCIETERLQYVGVIDTSDMRISLQDSFASHAQDLRACHPNGVFIRNYNMAETLLTKHAQQSKKARILIQHCGHVHMAGQQSEDPEQHYPGAHSLAAFFKKRGCTVVAVPAYTQNFSAAQLPVDTPLSGEDIFDFGHPPERKVRYSVYNNEHAHHQEILLVSPLLEALGLPNRYDTLDRCETYHAKKYKKTTKRIRKILGAHRG